jgi:oligoribonuclease NrnB/cAMP/cGMP phosphodiesterase (DHH superfamily)
MSIEQQRTLVEQYQASDKVFIVDFSFAPEVMRVLCLLPTVVWIDHHKTAMEQIPELWSSFMVEGRRSLTEAACSLTWQYLKGSDAEPKCVQYVADFDLWKFEYGETTKVFNEVAYHLLSLPLDWLQLLSSHADLSTLMIHGYALYHRKQLRVAKAVEKGIAIDWMGHKTLVVNSTLDSSDIGNAALDKGYEIGLVWRVEDSSLIVSLRSKGDLDVAKLAEKFGGGGHKNAAGFTKHNGWYADMLWPEEKGGEE